MLTPTRSAGSRSGVNWTRFHVQSIDAASALARLVLPTPGTSSMRRWPSASRHITAISIGSILPCTTWAMLAVTASNSAANRELGAFGGSGVSPPARRLGRTVTRRRRRRCGRSGTRCGRPPCPARTVRSRAWRPTWRSTSAPTDWPPASSTRPARSSSATGWPRRRATSGRRCTASCAGSSPPAPRTPIRSSVCGVSCEGPIDARQGHGVAAAPAGVAGLRAARAGRAS